MIERAKFIELADRFTKSRLSDNMAIERVLEALGNGHSVPSFGNEVESAFLDLLAASVANPTLDFQSARAIVNHFYYEAHDSTSGRLRPEIAKIYAGGADGKGYEIRQEGWGDIYDEITDWEEYFKSKTGVYPKPIAPDDNED